MTTTKVRKGHQRHVRTRHGVTWQAAHDSAIGAAWEAVHAVYPAIIDRADHAALEAVGAGTATEAQKWRAEDFVRRWDAAIEQRAHEDRVEHARAQARAQIEQEEAEAQAVRDRARAEYEAAKARQ